MSLRTTAVPNNVRTALLLAILAGTITGCASTSDTTTDQGPIRTLSAADFAKPVAATADTEQPARQAFPTISASDAREGINDVIVVEGVPESLQARATGNSLPVDESTQPSSPTANTESTGGKPPVAQTTAQPPTRTLGVDRSVGQINGRPIYASDFLKDMDDRLRRNAEKMKRADWVKDTYNLVGQKLRDQVRDELLLSEFNTTLKPEQKPGVAAFLTRVQEDLRSGSLGSETLANKRLLEEEGKTIREKAGEIADKAFIQDFLRRTIYSRVQVTAREVRRYYDNNPAEFREPGKAVFRVIRAPKEDTAKTARIETALASDEAFAAVAERESDWRRDQKDGRFLFEVKIEKDYAQSDFFGPAALNEAARALTAGGTTSRIDAGASAWWLLLETLSPPRTIPFFEAQLAIERKIKNDRYREEESRYFAGLLQRSSATNLEEMAIKITEFADQRYWGEGRVVTPAATPAPAPAPASAGAVTPK